MHARQSNTVYECVIEERAIVVLQKGEVVGRTFCGDQQSMGRCSMGDGGVVGNFQFLKMILVDPCWPQQSPVATKMKSFFS